MWGDRGLRCGRQGGREAERPPATPLLTEMADKFDRRPSCGHQANMNMRPKNAYGRCASQPALPMPTNLSHSRTSGSVRCVDCCA